MYFLHQFGTLRLRFSFETARVYCGKLIFPKIEEIG